VLEQPAGADALPALTAYLRDAGAQVVLTAARRKPAKVRACCRSCWPRTGLAAGGRAGAGGIDRRRLGHGAASLATGPAAALEGALPFLATVDNAAPKPRQSAYGPARRGVLAAHDVEVEDDELLAGELQPAKPRPKRLKVIKAKSGADRMKAATAKASGGGGKCSRAHAAGGAQAILKLLIEEGVVR
jgi:electron transfer flavoprotein beta subunit